MKNASVVLTPEVIQRLEASAKRLQGRPYDLTFEWSDTRVYCSELVWKIYERTLGLHIGELQHIKELNLTDPAVRAKMRERYGDNVPAEEPVITPVAMFNSSLLETVAER